MVLPYKAKVIKKYSKNQQATIYFEIFYLHIFCTRQKNFSIQPTRSS